MPRIIQPVVSPRGRVIVLTGATLWLIAAMVLSALPGGASATPRDLPVVTTTGIAEVIETLDGTDEPLYFPNVIADHGRIFVADRGTHRVISLNEDLTLDVIFGREGAGPGEMQLPYGVAADSQGNVFIVDIQLQRINKFAADGTFIKSVAAPQAAKLLIDSHDQLIVYPAPGEALMRRYSNDLEPGGEMFRDTNTGMHRARMGVLMAMDSEDRLFLLDQADLTLSVYSRQTGQLARWQVEGPGLQESLAARLALKREKNPNDKIGVPAFQAMALDPSGDYIAFAYLVQAEPDVLFTRVVWYTVDGQFIDSEDRTDSVYANALLPDGRLIEGSAEALTVFTRGPRSTLASRGN